MPIPGGGRYRTKTTASGKQVRLHFGRGGKVNEAKNLKTGATHTPSEFRADARRGRLGAGPTERGLPRTTKLTQRPAGRLSQRGR